MRQIFPVTAGTAQASRTSVVLRYAAFDAVPVRARSWIIWR